MKYLRELLDELFDFKRGEIDTSFIFEYEETVRELLNYRGRMM